MAEATKGLSRVLKGRRYEDYRSMKQYYSDRTIEEVLISGWGTTAGAEFEFASETTDYAGAAAQAYIRAELDDANQHSKYVYLQYQDATGAVQDWATADLDGADSATEVAIGSTDCYRVRQMYSEVESATGGGKMITLTDAAMAGGDNWAYIEDGNSRFSLQRFFTQPVATCASYLGKIDVKFPFMSAAATAIDGVILTIAYTPKVLNAGETGIAANITMVVPMNRNTVIEPLIELAPATEVSFSWNHTTTGQTVWFEATMLEVYATNSTPSS